MSLKQELPAKLRRCSNKQDHLTMNVALDQTIILGLRSLSSIDKSLDDSLSPFTIHILSPLDMWIHKVPRNICHPSWQMPSFFSRFLWGPPSLISKSSPAALLPVFVYVYRCIPGSAAGNCVMFTFNSRSHMTCYAHQGSILHQSNTSAAGKQCGHKYDRPYQFDTI